MLVILNNTKTNSNTRDTIPAEQFHGWERVTKHHVAVIKEDYVVMYYSQNQYTFCFSGNVTQLLNYNKLESHANKVLKQYLLLRNPLSLVASLVYDTPTCVCVNTVMRLDDFIIYPQDRHNPVLLFNREFIPLYTTPKNPFHRILYNYLISYSDLKYNNINEA